MSQDVRDIEPDGDGQRRFEAARRAAQGLCPGLTHEVPYDRNYRLPGPTLETYRQLFVIMGSARRSAGGDAIASLAQRGYVIAPTLAVLSRRSPPQVVAIDRPGVVWCGIGLPTSRRPWKLSEQCALALDLSAYPQLVFASAHHVLRIRRRLRREGHDLG